MFSSLCKLSSVLCVQFPKIVIVFVQDVMVLALPSLLLQDYGRVMLACDSSNCCFCPFPQLVSPPSTYKMFGQLF